MHGAEIEADGVLVRIRWAEPDLLLPGGDLDDVPLDAAERRRAARFRRPADAARFVAGRLLARQSVADLLGTGADGVEVTAHCSVCGRHDHGRPIVRGAGCQVSIAHAAGRAVAVAAGDGALVGVDVEHLPTLMALEHRGRLPAMLATLAERFPGAVDVAGPERLEPLRRVAAVAEQWTRLEALVKATGAGLAGPPPTGTQLAAARFVPIDLGPDYRAVVAVLPAIPGGHVSRAR